MERTHDLAQLLVSCWVLADSKEPADTNMPSMQGVLDRALKAAVDKKVFPDWARSELHFVDSRVGLKCVELPAILGWAQMAGLVTAPNPSYRSTQVQISASAAKHLIRELNVSENESKQWGKTFKEEVNSAEKLLESFRPAGAASQENC